MKLFETNLLDLKRMTIRGLDIKPLNMPAIISGNDENKNSGSVLIEKGFPFMLHRVSTSHYNLTSSIRATITLNNSKDPFRFLPVDIDLLFGQGFNQITPTKPQDKTGLKIGASWEPVAIAKHSSISVRLSRDLTPGETVNFLFEGERIRGSEDV